MKYAFNIPFLKTKPLCRRGKVKSTACSPSYWPESQNLVLHGHRVAWGFLDEKQMSDYDHKVAKFLWWEMKIWWWFKKYLFFVCVCAPLSYRSQSQIIVTKRTLSTVKFYLVSTSIWKYRTDTVWMEEYGIVQQAEIENHTGTALVEAKWMEYSLVMHYWESVPSKKGKAWVFVCEFMGMDIIKVTVHV